MGYERKMRKCPLLGVYVEETDVWDRELGYLRTLKSPVAHDCMGKLCINYEDGYCTWYKRDTYDVVVLKCNNCEHCRVDDQHWYCEKYSMAMKPDGIGCASYEAKRSDSDA